MGYDTIRFRFPYLGHSMVKRIKRQCLLRSGLDCASGGISYELLTGELFSSRGSRISVILRNEEWMVNRNGRPELVPCDPYILIEASVYKIRYRCNVHGVSNVFLEACRDFVALVEDLFGTDLPVADWWILYRVGVVSVYRLSKVACKEFFDGLQLMSSLCRKEGAAKYAMVVYFARRTTTIKFYHEGTESQVHDRGYLWGFFSQVSRHWHGHDEERSRALIERRVAAFQCLTGSRLRVEVGVHGDKLQYNFGKHPRVDEVTDAHLEGTFDTEIEKFLREEKQMIVTVRKSRTVLHRLRGAYDNSTGMRLYGFRSPLYTLGDEMTREYFAKTVFYWNHKQFEDAGMSWWGTDVLIAANTVLPHDFSPVRVDPRLCHLLARDREELQTSREMLRLAT